MPQKRSLPIQQKLIGTFYWLGIAMSLLCILLACAHNTQVVGRFEHAGFPLSWAAGVIAILAFLVFEYSDPVLPSEERSALRFSEALPETAAWETEFADS